VKLQGEKENLEAEKAGIETSKEFTQTQCKRLETAHDLVREQARISQQHAEKEIEHWKSKPELPSIAAESLNFATEQRNECKREEQEALRSANSYLQERERALDFVDGKNVTIKRLEREAGSLQATIVSKEAQIAERDRAIARLLGSTASMQAELDVAATLERDLTAELGDRDDEVARLTVKLEKSDEEVVRLTDELASSQAEADLATELEHEFAAEIEELDGQIARLQAQDEEQAARLVSLTAPVIAPLTPEKNPTPTFSFTDSPWTLPTPRPAFGLDDLSPGKPLRRGPAVAVGSRSPVSPFGASRPVQRAPLGARKVTPLRSLDSRASSLSSPAQPVRSPAPRTAARSATPKVSPRVVVPKPSSAPAPHAHAKAGPHSPVLTRRHVGGLARNLFASGPAATSPDD
jgi:hypothetical protein